MRYISLPAILVALCAIALFFTGLFLRYNTTNPLVLFSEATHLGGRCTQEARQCPDKSYVHRSGTSCEFETCPSTNSRIEEVSVPTTTPATPHREPPVTITSPTVPPQKGYACTMEAKQCPDGSYVGRTGPKCEFAACPHENTDTTSLITVSGSALVGPTCPVTSSTPNPQCADKPYAGTLVLTNTTTGKHYSPTTTPDGSFTVSLTRGVYDVSTAGGAPFPRCNGKIEVTGPSAHIPIMCDSGIR